MISSRTAPERLNAARLRAQLGADVLIGREIIVREVSGSTNDDVRQLAQEGVAEGVVVFAEQQTAGRGQRGNVWESAAYKGLWFSVLLRPQVPVSESARLTNWAAKTVSGTVASLLGCGPEVKPPNDIYVNGRKIAGVLVEMRAQAGAAHVAILGIGVNVNQQSCDFSTELRNRAASLAMLCGGCVDRAALAVTLLRNLDATYRAGLV